MTRFNWFMSPHLCSVASTTISHILWKFQNILVSLKQSFFRVLLCVPDNKSRLDVDDKDKCTSKYVKTFLCKFKWNTDDTFLREIILDFYSDNNRERNLQLEFLFHTLFLLILFVSIKVLLIWLFTPALRNPYITSIKILT